MHKLFAAVVLVAVLGALLGVQWIPAPEAGDAGRGAVLATVRGAHIYEADVTDIITYNALQMERRMIVSEELSYLYDEASFFQELDSYVLPPLDDLLDGLVRDLWLTKEAHRRGITATLEEMDSLFEAERERVDALARESVDAELYNIMEEAAAKAEVYTAAFYESAGITPEEFDTRYARPRRLKGLIASRLLDRARREDGYWYGSVHDIVDVLMTESEVRRYPIGADSAVATYYDQCATRIRRLRDDLADRAPSFAYRTGDSINVVP